ncbi:putative auxin-responsive protein SAUR36 [Cocos nucifera]|uniref:Putative auxin-responsive protein SAUR36 n=1 Tax=Cocos nucifera TaxID=13894 RepID=A0A8K0IJ14_COCNU|nr:putative auxin-responsive protein SAUR36 [Cocos nucifera]
MQLLQGGGGREPPLPPPPPPPKGHLAVYVSGGRKGKEAAPPRRFVVPVIDFNHPLFVELLREAEEEFGFDHPGGITIPCPVSRFERVRTSIAADLARTGLRVRRS